MPRIEYRRLKFTADHLDVIDQANGIIRNIQGQGYTLTLRQLYYQFVAGALIPNTPQSYKRLGDIVVRARLAGRIDWNALEDRTRNLRGNTHFEDPTSVMSAAAHSMRVDKWTDQPRRVEVWVEKDALVGVIGRVAGQRDLDYFACRGYVSQSEQWAAARRHRSYIENGQAVTILYLGDHDPSGIDMTRDVTDRLTEFLCVDWLRANPGSGLGSVATGYDSDEVMAKITAECGVADGLPALDVRRVALNFSQVQQYNPPPNPAKLTDSRSSAYVRAHGTNSWELDALDPATLAGLVDAEVDGIVDHDRFDARQRVEDRHRRLVTEASDRWDEVVEFLEGRA